MQTLTLTEANEIQFAAEGSGPRTFDMVAYTGAGVDTPRGTVVVDLSGLEVNTQRKPVLREHKRDLIVGQSKLIENTGTEVRVKGTISQRTAAGREVLELAEEGFPWQASMGLGVKAFEPVKEGKSVRVNGRDFAGPVIVIRRSFLKENSFAPLGADGATSAAVFSDDGSAPTPISSKEPDMTIDNVREFFAVADNQQAALELDFIKTAIGNATDDGFAAGREMANKKSAERFQSLLDLDGATAEFAAEQFLAGHDAEKATAVLAKKLAADLTAARAELAAARANDNGQGGVSADLTDNTKSSAELTADAAGSAWDNDPALQRQFPNKALYVSVKTTANPVYSTVAR